MGRRWNAVITLIFAGVISTSSVASAAPSEGALPANRIQTLQVAGNYGVPPDAEMVATMITAVQPAKPGHATVFPCGDDVPTASNVNYRAGDVIPNLALTKLSHDGTICVDTHARSDILVDIVGYVPNGSSITPLDQPTRVRDTRNSSKPGDASTIRVQITGRRGIPNDANVVTFNLTAAQADGPGHASVRSCDTPRTDGSTSSLNYTPARTTANFVVSRLSNDGAICIDVLTSTHLVVDVVATTNQGIHTLPKPIRIRDTRVPEEIGDGVFTLHSEQVQWIDAEAHPAIPHNAESVIYNLTSTRAVAPGHASSYPCAESDAAPFETWGFAPDRETSNLNFVPGRASAATTITQLSEEGGFCISRNTSSELIVDFIGYVTDQHQYSALEPIRMWDSRNAWRPNCDWTLWNVTTFGDYVDLMNLRTGVEHRIHLPDNTHLSDDGDLVHGHIDERLLSADCRSVWNATPDAQRSLARLHHVRSDGTAVRTDLPASSDDWGPGELAEGASGEIVWLTDSTGTIRDMRTGDVLAHGPGDTSDPCSDPSMSVRVEASAVNTSGIVAAVIDKCADQRIMHVANWRTGEVLGEYFAIDWVRSIDVSDEGDRVVLTTDREVDGVSRFAAEVRAIDGTLIDRRTSAPVNDGKFGSDKAVSARFLPDGRVRWCVADQPIGDWTPGGAVEWYEPVPDYCY